MPALGACQRKADVLSHTPKRKEDIPPPEIGSGRTIPPPWWGYPGAPIIPPRTASAPAGWVARTARRLALEGRRNTARLRLCRESTPRRPPLGSNVCDKNPSVLSLSPKKGELIPPANQLRRGDCEVGQGIEGASMIPPSGRHVSCTPRGWLNQADRGARPRRFPPSVEYRRPRACRQASLVCLHYPALGRLREPVPPGT